MYIQTTDIQTDGQTYGRTRPTSLVTILTRVTKNNLFS